MKNRRIRKTLRQIERLPLPAREKTLGSAALPPEPPRRLRALRFAGQAAAVAVVLALLTATLLFALRRPSSPPEASASGTPAEVSADGSSVSVTANSRKTGLAEHTIPLQTLPYTPADASNIEDAKAFVASSAGRVENGYACEVVNVDAASDYTGSACFTTIIKYADGEAVWTRELDGEWTFQTYAECGQGVVFADAYLGRIFMLSPKGEFLWTADISEGYCYTALLCEDERLLVWASGLAGGFCKAYDYSGRLLDTVQSGAFSQPRRVIAVGDGYAVLCRSGGFYANTNQQFDMLLLLDDAFAVVDEISYTANGTALALTDAAYADGRLYLSACDPTKTPDWKEIRAVEWSHDYFRMWAVIDTAMTDADIGAAIAEEACAYLLVCTADGLPQRCTAAPGCIAGDVAASAAGGVVWEAAAVMYGDFAPSYVSSHTFEGVAACDRYTLTADGALSAKERAGYKEFRCNVDIGAKTVQEIVDRTEIENIPTAEALEEFYADESYRYYFPSMKSEYVCVRFTDGTETTVAAALNKGWITLADLDRFGIGYYKEPKPHRIASIEWEDEAEDLSAKAVEELFWSDGRWDYYFPSVRSEYVLVTFVDGRVKIVAAALAEGEIEISDLDTFGIDYFARCKRLSAGRTAPPALQGGAPVSVGQAKGRSRAASPFAVPSGGALAGALSIGCLKSGKKNACLLSANSALKRFIDRREEKEAYRRCLGESKKRATAPSPRLRPGTARRWRCCTTGWAGRFCLSRMPSRETCTTPRMCCPTRWSTQRSARRATAAAPARVRGC